MRFTGSQKRGIWVPNTHGRFWPPPPSVTIQVTLMDSETPKHIFWTNNTDDWLSLYALSSFDRDCLICGFPGAVVIYRKLDVVRYWSWWHRISNCIYCILNFFFHVLLLYVWFPNILTWPRSEALISYVCVTQVPCIFVARYRRMFKFQFFRGVTLCP
jgi:hypothetical protein